jgi:N-acetylglucosaminyldiphosphoundecaprenol N-acetyl-beta-D-mannosaminyltransferase
MRAELLGAPLDLLTMEETLARAEDAIARGIPLRHVALNVAKLVNLRRDDVLRRDVAEAGIVGADGAGIVLAARLLGLPMPGRVAGVDLMERLFDRAAAQGWRPYLLGATPQVLARATARLRARHPALRLAGAHHGYFAPAEEPAVVAAIRASSAELLFVAMPTPRKERFLAAHGAALGVPFVMGVGGAFDVLAGEVARAPRWAQRAGLEWAVRMAQEPLRLGPRYLRTNAVFAAILLRAVMRRMQVNSRG